MSRLSARASDLKCAQMIHIWFRYGRVYILLLSFVAIGVRLFALPVPLRWDGPARNSWFSLLGV